VLELAHHLGTHKSLIQFAEQGCYRKIPPPYSTQKPSDNPNFARSFPVDPFNAPSQYLEFRVEKRRNNFTEESFPVEPPKTLKILLEYLELNPYQFACRICVQPTEVQKLLLGVRRRLPLNLQEGFLQVGLKFNWVQDFERNLKYGVRQ
jgi:hypothetical protein